MLEEMHGTSFDWLTWLNGGPKTLDILCRESEIIRNADRIRKYAIGYCNGEELICRPKKDCMGIMFIKDDIQFWFHLSKKEFNKIFKGEDNERRYNRFSCTISRKYG